MQCAQHMMNVLSFPFLQAWAVSCCRMAVQSFAATLVRPSVLLDRLAVVLPEEFLHAHSLLMLKSGPHANGVGSLHALMALHGVVGCGTSACECSNAGALCAHKLLS